MIKSTKHFLFSILFLLLPLGTFFSSSPAFAQAQKAASCDSVVNTGDKLICVFQGISAEIANSKALDIINPPLKIVFSLLLAYSIFMMLYELINSQSTHNAVNRVFKLLLYSFIGYNIAFTGLFSSNFPGQMYDMVAKFSQSIVANGTDGSISGNGVEVLNKQYANIREFFEIYKAPYYSETASAADGPALPSGGKGYLDAQSCATKLMYTKNFSTLFITHAVSKGPTQGQADCILEVLNRISNEKDPALAKELFGNFEEGGNGISDLFTTKKGYGGITLEKIREIDQTKKWTFGEKSGQDFPAVYAYLIFDYVNNYKNIDSMMHVVADIVTLGELAKGNGITDIIPGLKLEAKRVIYNVSNSLDLLETIKFIFMYMAFFILKTAIVALTWLNEIIVIVALILLVVSPILIIPIGLLVFKKAFLILAYKEGMYMGTLWSFFKDRFLSWALAPAVFYFLSFFLVPFAKGVHDAILSIPYRSGFFIAGPISVCLLIFLAMLTWKLLTKTHEWAKAFLSFSIGQIVGFVMELGGAVVGMMMSAVRMAVQTGAAILTGGASLAATGVSKIPSRKTDISDATTQDDEGSSKSDEEKKKDDKDDSSSAATVNPNDQNPNKGGNALTLVGKKDGKNAGGEKQAKTKETLAQEKDALDKKLSEHEKAYGSMDDLKASQLAISQKGKEASPQEIEKLNSIDKTIKDRDQMSTRQTQLTQQIEKNKKQEAEVVAEGTKIGNTDVVKGLQNIQDAIEKQTSQRNLENSRKKESKLSVLAKKSAAAVSKGNKGILADIKQSAAAGITSLQGGQDMLQVNRAGAAAVAVGAGTFAAFKGANAALNPKKEQVAAEKEVVSKMKNNVGKLSLAYQSDLIDNKKVDPATAKKITDFREELNQIMDQVEKEKLTSNHPVFQDMMTKYQQFEKLQRLLPAPVAAAPATSGKKGKEEKTSEGNDTKASSTESEKDALVKKEQMIKELINEKFKLNEAEDTVEQIKAQPSDPVSIAVAERKKEYEAKVSKLSSSEKISLAYKIEEEEFKNLEDLEKEVKKLESSSDDDGSRLKYEKEKLERRMKKLTPLATSSFARYKRANAIKEDSSKEVYGPFVATERNNIDVMIGNTLSERPRTASSQEAQVAADNNAVIIDAEPVDEKPVEMVKPRVVNTQEPKLFTSAKKQLFKDAPNVTLTYDENNKTATVSGSATEEESKKVSEILERLRVNKKLGEVVVINDIKVT